MSAAVVFLELLEPMRYKSVKTVKGAWLVVTRAFELGNRGPAVFGTPGSAGVLAVAHPRDPKADRCL